MSNAKPTTVEEYISQAPERGKAHLIQLRTLLKEIAPDAKEGLKWGNPAFESVAILFAYSTHNSHLTFTPTGPALAPFQKELTGYELRKDSVIFKYDKPLPVELIRKIAQYRKTEAEDNGAKWKY